ncbi:MAG: phytoene/squalene synthase family protein [Austwickia sp.]|nr:phytoene/squalene synthase family protein [Austwickia sp.]MBK8437818.1 phytoene/squalene synthase family protein [Austwickia sp.]
MNALADQRYCAQITRAHGTTYYWGVRLLAPWQRRHVYAVYALCRIADDIVDECAADQVGRAQRELAAFADDFAQQLACGGTGAHAHPALREAARAARALDIDPQCFARFFRAMEMDLSVRAYPTYADLLAYMDGSAAVIGELMLPVLQPRSAAALEPARALGVAFQLTNFLRDVAEDLDRGRVYLPQEDLDRFGADPWQRSVTPAWRALMAFQIARARGLYAEADIGLEHLPPASARCVRTARHLYSSILDLIEEADYDVFSGRLVVPTWHKAWYASRMALGPPPRTAPRAPAPVPTRVRVRR